MHLGQAKFNFRPRRRSELCNKISYNHSSSSQSLKFLYFSEYFKSTSPPKEYLFIHFAIAYHEHNTNLKTTGHLVCKILTMSHFTPFIPDNLALASQCTSWRDILPLHVFYVTVWIISTQLTVCTELQDLLFKPYQANFRTNIRRYSYQERFFVESFFQLIDRWLV